MNQMHGDERTVFEYTADLVRYHTCFMNGFVEATANDALIDKLGLLASEKVRLEVTMSTNAKTFVSDVVRLLDGVYRLTFV
jgi:hypothetical protein